MKKNEWEELARAFEEASSIAFGLVAIPVVFLVMGIFADKALATTPLFIIIGILAGIFLGIYRSIKISKNYKIKIKKNG